MANLKQLPCKLCGKMISGYGLADLQRNMDAHMKAVHSEEEKPKAAKKPKAEKKPKAKPKKEEKPMAEPKDAEPKKGLLEKAKEKLGLSEDNE